MRELEFGEEYEKWVSEHVGEDPARLRLSYHDDPRPWIPYAITQVSALRKAEKKFCTAFGESLMPTIIASEIALQQSTSADIALLHASILANHISIGDNVLDMTCGLGTDARALSRYFNVVACENNPLHAAMARENFRDNANIKILETDSVDYLQSVKSGQFKAIFIDPARRDNLGKRVYGIRECSPDIIEIYPLFKKTGAVIICKLSPMIDVTQTLADIQNVSEIHIIGDGRECKELVVLINPDKPVQRICDVPISLWSTPHLCNLQYTIADEVAAISKPYASPLSGDTLWIPSPVAMKGGCFNILSSKYDISPVAPNTHVYISKHELLHEFPGTGEKIVDVIPWKSSELKKLKRMKINACARVRNFGMTAQQLSDKIGLYQTVDYLMITGITLADKSRVLVVSKPQ